MGRDKSFTKSKNPDSKRYKKDMARHLDGMALKCVTERINGIEEVIGKSGAIILKGDELIVYSGQEILVRVLTFPDPDADEGERTVVAYYSYYRKLED